MIRDPGCHVRAGQRRLLARDAAANGVEVEAGILRRLNRDAQILAEERRDLDPSFFHIENHRSAGRQFLPGCSRMRSPAICAGKLEFVSVGVGSAVGSRSLLVGLRGWNNLRGNRSRA